MQPRPLGIACACGFVPEMLSYISMVASHQLIHTTNTCVHHAPCMSCSGPANASLTGGVWPQLALDIVYSGRISMTVSTKVELQRAGLYNTIQVGQYRQYLQYSQYVHALVRPQ